MNRLPELVFDMPWLLAAIVLLPLLVWWLRAARMRMRESRLDRFAERPARTRLMGLASRGSGARTFRLVAVAVLSGLALAGPRWGLARGPANARGIDMAIALDASLSMMAGDDRPSRLERMKQEVRRLRAMSQADRVALIAFAGRSYILTPLTGDDGAIELFLENLDPSIVGQAGSSLSRAIRQGTELLLASDGSAGRALVLMSDGESFEPVEDLKAAAEEAGAQGISLVTVGFGTVQGSTIPVREGNTVRQKQDENGNIVITRYHPELLEIAATASGGRFIPAEASDKATRVRAALRGLKTARRNVDSREDHVPRFLWLLIPALALLMFDTWVMARGATATALGTAPRTRSNSTGTTSAGAAVVALLLLVGVSGCRRDPDPALLLENGDIVGALAVLSRQIADGDTNAVTRYNFGSTLLAADSLGASAELLEAVRRSAEGETRMRARFNAGLASLLIGRDTLNSESGPAFAAALAAYRAYLLERPGDIDAKWNYELALRPKPPSGGGGGGGGGNQDDQPDAPEPQPQGGIDQKQAEALLNSAAREERDVQGKKQKQGRVPPNGKDW
ncbi:MAG TPA: VWA domain-containing protein [Gemmatimonas sp.]|nr:VWA domain-containing protein [Gemmatimonas sp.]